jgi:hypothetical protein
MDTLAGKSGARADDASVREMCRELGINTDHSTEDDTIRESNTQTLIPIKHVWYRKMQKWAIV